MYSRNSIESSSEQGEVIQCIVLCPIFKKRIYSFGGQGVVTEAQRISKKTSSLA